MPSIWLVLWSLPNSTGRYGELYLGQSLSKIVALGLFGLIYSGNIDYHIYSAFFFILGCARWPMISDFYNSFTIGPHTLLSLWQIIASTSKSVDRFQFSLNLNAKRKNFLPLFCSCLALRAFLCDFFPGQIWYFPHPFVAKVSDCLDNLECFWGSLNGKLWTFLKMGCCRCP